MLSNVPPLHAMPCLALLCFGKLVILYVWSSCAMRYDELPYCALLAAWRFGIESESPEYQSLIPDPVGRMEVLPDSGVNS